MALKKTVINNENCCHYNSKILQQKKKHLTKNKDSQKT